MHRRYADPSVVMSQWASVSALTEFCMQFWTSVKEEEAHSNMWDIWLHKDFERSWDDYKAELERRAKILNMTDEDKAAIVAQSYEILESFKPA